MNVHALRLHLLAVLLCAIATCVPAVWGKKTGCEAEFKGKCTCRHVIVNPQKRDEPRQFVTNCTNTEFTDTEMLQELPINTEMLIFTGNRITKIPNHVFGTQDYYSKLKKIDLSNNGIRRIDKQAFKRTTQHVQELTLTGNMWELDDDSNIFTDFPQLRTLHLVGAFGLDQSTEHILEYLRKYFEEAREQLVNLEVLHLEDNYFEQLDDDSFFCLLPNLRLLYLSSNKISSFKLTPRCIHSVPHLELIDLSRNNLQFLSNSTLEALDTIDGHHPIRGRQIDLNYNNFPCNCSINEMLQWMEKTETQLVRQEEYTCTVVNPSDDVTTMRLEDLEGNLLPCIETTQQSYAANPSPSPSHAGYIVLATILVILVAISAGLAFINRTAVQHFLRHRASPLQHKFEYSTIGGRRDANEVDV